MIYVEPRLFPLADSYLAVEFGDEADIRLNFRVLDLTQKLEAEKLIGVIEIVPTFRTLGIVFDRATTSHDVLSDVVRQLLKGAEHISTLASRVITLPVWYDDPWSAAVANRYGMQRNIELIAEQNGLTVPEAIERHSGATYWVVCVGFTPGCYFSVPLERERRMLASKYKTPRSYTPARTLSMAGFSTCTYPVASPGGYQLIGRLAVNVYEAQPKNKAFGPDGVLTRAGDRLRFRMVDPLEYEDIWERVQRGVYDYDIVPGQFNVIQYLASLEEQAIA
jgi:urea carboxylase